MRWRHPESVPRAVVDTLPLAAGERVLAGARDTADHWHVGTDAALYVTTDGEVTRRPWESLEGATWDRDSDTLTVVELSDYGETQPRHVLNLEEPGRFLELVRERITASVLVSRPFPVDAHRRLAVTVVARRSPARTGDVAFSILLDPALDPSDPRVRDVSRTGLEQVRDELGL